jgi:hypothetical protein
MKKYFYKLLQSYLDLFIRPEDRYLRIDAQNLAAEVAEPSKVPDYVVIDGQVHYLKDIQSFFENLYTRCLPTTRVIVIYYSAVWRPVLQLATWLGLRNKTAEQNWVGHEDMANFLLLSGFEIVRLDQRVLCPLYIPLISGFLNRFIAPLPFFRLLCMVNILVARPVIAAGTSVIPSVSVVVPARNEAGNIEKIIERLPLMGPHDELIFVEGNSTDDTWEKIEAAAAKYGSYRTIIVARQDGKGKGDAVRKGFSLATQDVLMILDADMTVPPEDLPKFYRALVQNKGEFINGSRLVYPMEGEAMRFLNMLGNKFFAMAFSFVLGQRFKDTLCGTKVLSRHHYQRLVANRKFFGDFDPFGDFDLIFGAARLGLKIVELPIEYKNRTYGTTNISRWTHGAILLRMLVFAALRLKFI